MIDLDYSYSNSYVEKYGLLDEFVEDIDIFEFSFLNSNYADNATIIFSVLVSVSLLSLLQSVIL